MGARSICLPPVSTRRQAHADVPNLRALGLKRCPRCRVVIEKNGGCNQMVCRCGCRFRWSEVDEQGMQRQSTAGGPGPSLWTRAVAFLIVPPLAGTAVVVSTVCIGFATCRPNRIVRRARHDAAGVIMVVVTTVGLVVFTPLVLATAKIIFVVGAVASLPASLGFTRFGPDLHNAIRDIGQRAVARLR